MEKLSPEEHRQMEDFKSRAPNMTPEERRDAMSKLPIFKDMPPEQRDRMEQRFEHKSPGGSGGEPGGPSGGNDPAMQEQRRNLRERLSKLTPEERQQLKDFREKTRNMTPEERRKAAADLPVFKQKIPRPVDARGRIDQASAFDQNPFHGQENIIVAVRAVSEFVDVISPPHPHNRSS